MGLFEKKRRPAFRGVSIVDPHRQPHAPVDFPFVRFLKEPAAHVAQKLAHFRLAQVLDLGICRPAVVPRHPGRLLNQTPEHVAAPLGVNGLGAETDPVPPRPVMRRCAVGPHLARRRPDNQDEPVFNRFRRQNRRKGRVQPVAVAANPLLRRLDLLGGQTRWGQGGAAFAFLNAHDDVTAVQVVIVVRKGADRSEDLRPGRALVPGGFEFDALRLHTAAMEKVVQIDGENLAHGRATLVRRLLSQLVSALNAPAGFCSVQLGRARQDIVAISSVENFGHD